MLIGAKMSVRSVNRYHPNGILWVRENLMFRMCEKIENSARICDVIDIILQSTLKICMEDERWH